MDKEYLKEVDKKEAIDALCVLFHCARKTKDKKYTTQKEQFKIVEYYIEKQEKIIDKMAEFMNRRSWKEHQLKSDTCDCCKVEYASDECVECIKTYFEEMVENEG